MTVVAVKVEKNKVTLSADSACTSGYTTISNADSKSFVKIKKVGDYVIAGAGLCSDISLLFMYAKTNLIKSNNEDAVIDWFKDFLDWKKKKTDLYGLNQSVFILAYESKAYYFESFLVVEIKEKFAIGSGRDFAISAMHNGADTVKAVETACEFDVFCGLPVTTFETTK